MTNTCPTCGTEHETEMLARSCAVLLRIGRLLATKNASYGDSAWNPVRIFSRSPADEQLRVRLDDKLSRIARGNGDLSEDTLLDLAGYLILYMARKES